MFTILSPLLGIIGSVIPTLVRFMERKAEIQYELELTKLKLASAERQAKMEVDVAVVRADVDEGKSVREHDTSLAGNEYFEKLRASIRPVITYTFFGLFVVIKVAAVIIMANHGNQAMEILKAVWDIETMALFSTIVAFWFGSRTLEKSATRMAQMYIVKNPEKKK